MAMAVRDSLFTNNAGHGIAPHMYSGSTVTGVIERCTVVANGIDGIYLYGNGSGTTVKVARELGRHGIGYERELQYKPAIMEKLGVVADEGISVESDETVLKVRTEDVEVVEAEGEAFNLQASKHTRRRAINHRARSRRSAGPGDL